MIVELLQHMRAGQELSCFKLKKIQSSWYFRTSYGKIFETVVEHLSRHTYYLSTHLC